MSTPYQSANKPVAPQKSSVTPFNQATAEIIVPWELMQQYRYLIEKMKNMEVQFFSTIDRILIEGSFTPAVGTGFHSKAVTKPDQYSYWLDGIFIPEQQVTGTEVDTDPMGMYKLIHELRETHRLYDEDDQDIGPDNEEVNFIVGRMHMWAHSHPFSSATPSPSGQDEKNFREWVARNNEEGLDTPMIMLIFGKGEGIYARVYEPRLPGVFFSNVPVRVLKPDTIDTSYIDDSIANKVRRRTYGAGQSKSTPGKRAGMDWGQDDGDEYGHWDHQKKQWVDGPRWMDQHAGVSHSGSSKASTPGKAAPAKKTEVDPEVEAFRIFSKRWPAGADDFAEFMTKMNSEYDNSEHVKKWKAFMDRWLHNHSEWRIFIIGLFGKDEDVRKLIKLPKCNPEATDEDLILGLADNLNSTILILSECILSLSFAKKFSKKTTAKGKGKVVDSFINKRNAASAELVMRAYKEELEAPSVANSGIAEDVATAEAAGTAAERLEAHLTKAYSSVSGLKPDEFAETEIANQGDDVTDAEVIPTDVTEEEGKKDVGYSPARSL